VLLVATLIGATAAGPVAADQCIDDVWLISTRSAPRATPAEDGDACFSYWRLQSDGHWQQSEAKEFFAGESVTTTVFVHGNRNESDEVVGAGWQILGRLKRDADDPPCRFVIWSWPADRIRGSARRDVRVKSCYSDVQAHYLAEWLDRADPSQPVSLVGFSFGARVITGALHLLGGGELIGKRLSGPRSSPEPPPRRAVLIAAALGADWLLPGRRNGQALSQVERVLVTRNRRDPVLRLYPRINGRGGSTALGYTGPACGSSADKLEVVDVACSVGRIHRWTRYSRAPQLCSRLEWYVFLDAEDGR